MNYKYMRVSTDKQDTKRQEMLLEGIQADKVFIDKLSGKNTNRPQLNKLRLEAQNGDNVYIESISRLGRNVDDLRALCEEFRAKGVVVHFLKEGLNTNGDTYKFLLTILGAVAEMERETTVQRVREGVAKAQKYGTKSGRPFGRPQAELHPSFSKYYERWKRGEITAIEFAKLVEVSRPTLYRHIKIHESQQVDGKLKEENQVDSKGEKYKQVKL
jgi:DNA invertase Pin-like site-specific DNA recombinase